MPKKTFRHGDYYAHVRCGKRTVKEGECAAIWDMSGKRKIILGPQRVRLWFSHVRFLDRHVAEAFFMGGRVVLTSDLLYLTPGSVTVSATSRVTLNAAVVHSMGDIHTSVDEVLAAHVDHDH